MTRNQGSFIEEDKKMKYYICGAIGGAPDCEPGYDSLEEAKRICEQWEQIDIDDGNEPGYWFVIDEDGNRC